MNPILPGFNPDPSVVLVDGAYYLVTLDIRIPAGDAGLPQRGPTESFTGRVPGLYAVDGTVAFADVTYEGSA